MELAKNCQSSANYAPNTCTRFRCAMHVFLETQVDDFFCHVYTESGSIALKWHDAVLISIPFTFFCCVLFSSCVFARVCCLWLIASWASTLEIKTYSLLCAFTHTSLWPCQAVFGPRYPGNWWLCMIAILRAVRFNEIQAWFVHVESHESNSVQNKGMSTGGSHIY